MTGRGLSVKQRSISLRVVPLIALNGLAEEGVALHKLACKSFHDFLTDLVAAAPDRGSENSHLVPRIRPKDASQLAHRFFDDPGQGAAPSRMDRPHYAEPRVGYEHG